MTAYNVVRFRTKHGQEQAFIDAHKQAKLNAKGFRRAALVKTGERSFCIIGEWKDMDSLAAARPAMIALLDSFRNVLEDLGSGLGVTDPVSGSVVLEMRPRGAAAGKSRSPAKTARRAGRGGAKKAKGKRRAA
jgi:hypothetical protein